MDHSALRYLFAKQDAKPRLIRGILLLQEFDIEIRNKKGAENLATDHLSQLENPNLGKLTKAEIRDLFPKEQQMMIFDKSNEPWYGYCKNHKKTVKAEQTQTPDRKECTRAEDLIARKVKSQL
ncbi:hypothetical protein Tco_0348824 [Tanacetum coccineum]